MPDKYLITNLIPDNKRDDRGVISYLNIETGSIRVVTTYWDSDYGQQITNIKVINGDK